MTDPEVFTGRKESFVVVTGKDGEEYICPKSAIKKKKDLTPEELKECIPDSQTGGGSSIGG